MNHARKIELLRHIRFVLTQEKTPSLRAAGLSLQDVMELQKEKLLDLRVVDDSAVDELGNYRIHGLSDAGAALLDPPKAPTAPALPSEPQRQPQPSKQTGMFAKRIGDLLKIAAGIAIGWYLKKYFG